jgi:hypothetical protein
LKNRRVLMYLKSPFASPPIVRAPQTRIAPFSGRMMLTPLSLSWS